MSKTHKAGLGVGLVALVLILMMAWPDSRDDRESTPSPNPVTQTLREEAPAPPQVKDPTKASPSPLEDTPDTDYWTGRYSVQFNATVEGPDPRGGTQRGSLVLRAELNIAPAHDLGEAWYAGHFGAPNVQADASMYGLFGLDAADPTRGLEGHFAFRVDDSGRLLERRYANNLAPTSSMLASFITGGLQTSPSPDGSTTWVASELDHEAHVDVTYTRLSPTELRKTWRVIAPDGTSRDGGGRENEVRITLLDARVQSASWTSSATFDLAAMIYDPSLNPGGGAPPPMVYTNASRMQLERVGDDPAVAALVPTMLSPQMPSVALADPEPARTVDELLEIANRAEPAHDHQMTTQLVQDLATHARRDDAVVARYEMLLLDPSQAARRNTLIDALATANTPRAKKAMADIIVNKDAPGYVRKATTSASGFLEEPGDDVLESLWAHAFEDYTEEQMAALWALASQGKNLRDSDPDEATRIDEAIVARAVEVFTELAPAKPFTKEHRGKYTLWMLALGNLGGERLYPIIAPWLEHESEYVRADAVDSLRFVHTPESRGAILTAIRDDESDEVRRDALLATQYFPQYFSADFEAALVQALEVDESPRVRLAAAHVLTVRANSRPELWAPIRAAVAREQDEDVKELLAGYLPENDVVNPDRTGALNPTPSDSSVTITSDPVGGP